MLVPVINKTSLLFILTTWDKVVFNKLLQLEVISFNYFSIMHSLEKGHMLSPNFR